MPDRSERQQRREGQGRENRSGQLASFRLIVSPLFVAARPPISPFLNDIFHRPRKKKVRESRKGILTIHQLGSHLIGISELLEEAGVLGNSSHAKRLVLASDGVDEVVVGDGLLGDDSDDIRGVCLER